MKRTKEGMLIIMKSEAKKPIVGCRSPSTGNFIVSSLPYPELNLLYRTHAVSWNREYRQSGHKQFTEKLFTKPKPECYVEMKRRINK